MEDDRGAAPEPDGTQDDGRRRRLPSALSETLWVVAVALVVAVVLRTFVGQAFFIPSESMTPQLEIGDRVVVSKISYRLHEPRRGDVVVFDCPPGAGCLEIEEELALPTQVLHAFLEALGLRQPSTEEFIKRVVALPGETVEGRGGSVYVDGRRLIEPYLPEGMGTNEFPPVTVPEGHLWLMGDNRGNSTDSLVFGPVDTDTVVGRSVLRVWPPPRVAYL